MLDNWFFGNIKFRLLWHAKHLEKTVRKKRKKKEVKSQDGVEVNISFLSFHPSTDIPALFPGDNYLIPLLCFFCSKIVSI